MITRRGERAHDRQTMRCDLGVLCRNKTKQTLVVFERVPVQEKMEIKEV